MEKERSDLPECQEREREIAEIRARLARLDIEKAGLEASLVRLLAAHEVKNSPPSIKDAPVTNASNPASKIALFRALFRGREDVFPKRWDNAKTGKAGYAPACANEWAPRICGKPKVKCGDCVSRAFLPVTDEVIDGHLRGRHTVGVYPMLADETCWFLAADFDKATWRDDAAAFLQACAERGVPASIERSRSGQGAHVWIFFAEPVPASLARRLGAHLVTETMERNPDIGFASYDRFFPHRVVLRTTEFAVRSAIEGERPPIQQLYAALASNDARNALIFDDVLNSLEEKRSPLILTERKDHAVHLAERLSRFARNVVVLTGGMGAKQWRATMQQLYDIPVLDERVLIATGRYIGEGFDDARLDTLFLAMPVAWKGTLAQYVGRLHRLHPAKREVVVYDYVDEAVPVLKRMSEKRVRGYKSFGYSIGDN